MNNIDTFDIKAWLEDRNISFRTSGKNISRKYIGMECPFCHDSSTHFGINLETKSFNCWICGETGNIIKLIKRIEEPNQSIRKIIDEFQQTTFKELKRDIQIRHNENILPKEASKNFPEEYLRFLKEKRKFDPYYLIKKYDLYACPNIGQWKFRIIIPIITNGVTVSFTAMDISGNSKKYIHCSNENSIIPVKETLYNIDSVRKSCLIVEGVVDVWRIGDGTVAIFGTNMTSEQRKLLVDKKIERVFICLDNDAKKQAEKIGRFLSGHFKVETIELEEGDPDSSPNEIVKELQDLLK